MKTVLLLLLMACPFLIRAQIPLPQLSNLTQLCTNCERVDACHRGCRLNAELLYDAPTGAPCPAGGNAYQIWTMHYDGSNKVNLSATAPGLLAFTGKLNQGNAKWSPDGKWIVLQVQSGNSIAPCNISGTNPGSGFEQNVVVCTATASRCWQLTFNIPGTGSGVLHPQWTSDLGYLYWMNILGTGNTDANFYGTLRSAPFSTLSNTPTLGPATDFTDGINATNWYEPAGYMPNNPCQIFVTSGVHWNTTQIFSFNVCQHTGWTPVTPLTGAGETTGPYSEFHNCDSTSSLALVSSSRYTPKSIPPAGTITFPEDDLTLMPCSSSAWTFPLTFYNSPKALQYIPGPVYVPHPVWAAGLSLVLFTVESPGASSIWSASFTL